MKKRIRIALTVAFMGMFGNIEGMDPENTETVEALPGVEILRDENGNPAAKTLVRKKKKLVRRKKYISRDSELERAYLCVKILKGKDGDPDAKTLVLKKKPIPRYHPNDNLIGTWPLFFNISYQADQIPESDLDYVTAWVPKSMFKETNEKKIIEQLTKSDNYSVVSNMLFFTSSLRPEIKILVFATNAPNDKTSVNLPDGVNMLPFAFAFTNYTEISVSSPRYIPEYAFFMCKDLTKVILKHWGERICDRAFASCPNLSQINLPWSVSYIAPNAFEGRANSLGIVASNCSLFQTDETKCPDPKETNVLGSHTCGQGPTVVNREEPHAFFFEPESPLAVGQNFSFEIPSRVTLTNANSQSQQIDITEVAPRALMFLPTVTEVILHASIEIIHNGAFHALEYLRRVIIPVASKLAIIGDEAFEDCYDLSEVYIPRGVKKIGDSAFFSCFSLKKIKFDENSDLQEIGASCFHLAGISSLALPSKLMAIGDEAFAACWRLGIIEFPENKNIKLGKQIFKRCDEYCIIMIPAENRGLVSRLGIKQFRP